MRAAVIGASGFIGLEVVRELARRGDDVVAIDHVEPKAELGDVLGVTHAIADIRRIETLYDVLDGVDEIYHFAGLLGTSELDVDVRDSIDVNIVGAINVLEAAIKRHVPRVFFASKIHVWLNTYTITKHAAEQFCRLYTRMYPVQVCSLRYLNIFGPRQKLYPVRKMIPVFAMQAMRGLPIQIFGDGEQTVDMLYSKDAARITVDYLRMGFVDRALDCGSGVAVTVNAVAETVNRHYGNSAGILHIPMRKGESDRSIVVADLQPLRQVMGEIDFTPYDEAMNRTLEWYGKLDEHAVNAALAYHGIHQPYGVSWI